MSTANVAVRYCSIESIPPVHFGEVCVEFERLDVASSRNRHSSRNDVDPTNIAFKLTKGTDHDTQRVSAIETTQNMLNIDDVGEVYVSGTENNTVHIIPQDRSPSVRNCDNYETPRFAFSDRVLTLINLSREFPRIGVVLADGTLHLLVRMRMMPWILGDTIKPDFPKFDCDSLSVSYSVAHNCLLWLFQRLEQNRAKHKLSFELWVHHLNWPLDLLIRSKRRPDYMLAQGLPGPGRVMAFSCHMLMFFSNGVLSLPFSEVRFDPIPTSEALKTRHAPEVQLWQPGQRRATTLDLNQLQLRSQFRLWLRGVFHNVQREFGVAIFGDLCFKFTVRAHGLHCEPMFYLANVQSPLAESRAPLRFIFDEQDNGVLILHDGSYLCVVHRSFTRGNCEYDMSFRGIPGTLVPADGVPTAIFRALGAPPLTVRVVKNYMAKNGTYM